MKNLSLLVLVAVLSAAATWLLKSHAAEYGSFQVAEYVTIRWDGRDNTHLIRPSGKSERLKALMARFPKPDGIDERAFYMNVAMNSLAREGYEFAGMTPDDIVMKRLLPR